MILEEETFKEFGYYPTALKPHSVKKILAACDDCGKVRVTTKNAYCSLCILCTTKGEKSHLFGKTGKESLRWKGGLVKRICEQCSKEFEVKPSGAKRGRGRFCSRKCYLESRKNKVKRICEQCGGVFELNACVIKDGGGRFCSKLCSEKKQIGEDCPAWKGGISFEPYCSKFNFAFKEYIRNKFGRVCFLCKKTESENGQRLSVHHVNYNKNCGCDDDMTCQFVPLCRSCNSKVNSNREMWEGKIKNKMRTTLKGWYI